MERETEDEERIKKHRSNTELFIQKDLPKWEVIKEDRGANTVKPAVCVRAMPVLVFVMFVCAVCVTVYTCAVCVYGVSMMCVLCVCVCREGSDCDCVESQAQNC